MYIHVTGPAKINHVNKYCQFSCLYAIITQQLFIQNVTADAQFNALSSVVYTNRILQSQLLEILAKT